MSDFLTVVGPTAYRLLKMLASPKKLDEFAFSELVELVMSHYNLKPSPIVKRFEFNSRCQKEGESIATYVVELRKIAEHCQFGAVLNDMLRDRLVCGTVHRAIQKRVLVEQLLTFEKAIKMALAAEAADKDSLRLTGATTKDKASLTPVNKVGDQKPHRNKLPPAAAGSSKSKCYRCGRGHLSSQCPCREYVCHCCKKKGHLSKMCRKKGKGNKPKDKQAKVLTDEDDDPMHRVESGSHKPYKAVINVNGNSLPMEIDMEALVSVIGKETFESIKEEM